MRIYEQEQIDGMQEVDKELGYINSDEHVHRMFEALNLLTPDQRETLLD